jgi:antitoxin (DNA-binding transcriptional repressor) of toxin-antitoxin stability system
METTTTELRRSVEKLLDRVLHHNESVVLTDNGKTVAELRPQTQPISGSEFARLWKSRSKLDKATADAVAENIAELKKAECGS